MWLGHNAEGEARRILGFHFIKAGSADYTKGLCRLWPRELAMISGAKWPRELGMISGAKWPRELGVISGAKWPRLLGVTVMVK